MEKSATRVTKENNDSVVNKSWVPSLNDVEALKEEDTRINTQEGGHKNPGNYNKRASPGKAIKEKEAEKAKNAPPSPSSEDNSAKAKPNKIVLIAGAVLTVAWAMVLITAAVLN